MAEQDGAPENETTTVDFRKAKTVSDSAGKLSTAEQKESAARTVGLIITWTFALSAAAILAGAYRILRWQPTEAKSLLVDAGVPLLEKGGLFLSSTFGPLLAFVLGYYFGEKGKTS